MLNYTTPNTAQYLKPAFPRAADYDSGKLVILNPDGLYVFDPSTLQSNYLQNSSVNGVDVCTVANGLYAIATSTGIILYDAKTKTTKIAKSPAIQTTSKVVYKEGYILHLLGKTLNIYDLNLKLLASQVFGVTVVNAIEYTKGYLFIGGYNQGKVNGEPVQVAFIYRMGFDGKVIRALPIIRDSQGKETDNQGKLWGFNTATLTGNEADTRVIDLFTADDKVYALCAVYGGNSIFRYNGKNLSTQTLITTDHYTSGANTRDETKVYVAKIDVNSFVVEAGQLAVPRLGDSGNAPGSTFFPQTIFADDNDIYIGGISGNSLPNRKNLTWLNSPLPPYSGDASLLVVSKDFKQRRAWVSPGGAAKVLLFNSNAAVLSTKENVFELKTTGETETKKNTYAIIW